MSVISVTFISKSKTGFSPTSTFEEALARAKKYVGNNPRILCTPDFFTGGMGVHLNLKS